MPWRKKGLMFWRFQKTSLSLEDAILLWCRWRSIWSWHRNVMKRPYLMVCAHSHCCCCCHPSNDSSLWGLDHSVLSSTTTARRVLPTPIGYFEKRESQGLAFKFVFITFRAPLARQGLLLLKAVSFADFGKAKTAWEGKRLPEKNSILTHILLVWRFPFCCRKHHIFASVYDDVAWFACRFRRTIFQSHVPPLSRAVPSWVPGNSTLRRWL